VATDTTAASTARTSPMTYVPPSYAHFPYSTEGLAFFTQNGQNYYCQASAINSPTSGW
jgi:hypothetical protein